VPTTTPSTDVVLLQSGVLLVVVLVVQMVALRNLPVETIPGVLRARVERSNRMRPWLMCAAAGMVSSGVLLLLDR